MCENFYLNSPMNMEKMRFEAEMSCVKEAVGIQARLRGTTISFFQWDRVIPRRSVIYKDIVGVHRNGRKVSMCSSLERRFIKLCVPDEQKRINRFGNLYLET